ncbi:hypothetical protein AK812_SmicGene46465, partial [Symbiodinium microadriaticum]
LHPRNRPPAPPGLADLQGPRQVPFQAVRDGPGAVRLLPVAVFPRHRPSPRRLDRGAEGGASRHRAIHRDPHRHCQRRGVLISLLSASDSGGWCGRVKRV